MRTEYFPYAKVIRVVTGLTVAVLLLARCVNPEAPVAAVETTSPHFREFAGSQACASCHREIAEGHLQTAHHNTSRRATAENIFGSFDSLHNVFAFTRDHFVRMEKRDDRFYQVEYSAGAERLARRFDFVFGSGAKGQTYLNWANNTLLQLPISYFTASNSWSNSPGYPERPVFSRPVTVRCLECHATYAQDITLPGDHTGSFDEKQLILGVECEKCHGPGAAHVAFQRAHPKDTLARFIANPARFSRQQSLDLCRDCHGGRLTKIRPSFLFEAGDTLANYFNMDSANTDPTNIDVHGNQYGLLAASKCFRDESLTCNSCHDNHHKETGRLAVFSGRCTSCHQPGMHGKTCPLTAKLGNAINRNCIDCHMPVQPSRAIMVFLQGDTNPTAATMRSHLIKIYPEETLKVLARMKKG